MKLSRMCHFGQLWHLILAYSCIEEVLSCQPVFKSSKSDHYEGSYGHLKLTMFHPTPLGYPLAKFTKISCTPTFHVLKYFHWPGELKTFPAVHSIPILPNTGVSYIVGKPLKSSFQCFLRTGFLGSYLVVFIGLLKFAWHVFAHSTV